MLSKRYFPYVAALSDRATRDERDVSTRVSARPKLAGLGQPSSEEPFTTRVLGDLSAERHPADEPEGNYRTGPIGPLDDVPRERAPACRVGVFSAASLR